MRYKCIVSDLDFTILGPKNYFPENTKKALTTLLNKGIMFVPASGRALSSFPEEVLNLPNLKYVITSNGVTIHDYSAKKNVFNSILEADAFEKLDRLISKYFITYEAFIDGIPYTSRDYYEDPVKYLCYENQVYETPEKLDGLRNYVKTTRKSVDDIRAFMREHCHELDCIDVITSPAYRNEIEQLIINNLKNLYVTSSSSHLIELSALGTGKHACMERVAKLLDIPLSEIVAFGDGDNDSEMLRMAGYGVAVKNGTEKCRNAADYVTDYCEEEGVYKVLKTLFSDELE